MTTATKFSPIEEGVIRRGWRWFTRKHYSLYFVVVLVLECKVSTTYSDRRDLIIKYNLNLLTSLVFVVFRVKQENKEKTDNLVQW